MKWCRVGKQVGFGCDFTTASDVTQVSSAFFFSGLETLRLNGALHMWMGIPGFSGQPKIPVGFGLPSSGSGNGPSAAEGMGPSCTAPLSPITSGAELLVGYPKEHPQPQTCC